MASKKTPNQRATTPDEAVPTTVKADIVDTLKFKRYWSKMPEYSSYKSVKEHLRMMTYGVMHGFVSSKAANTVTYIASHVLIAMDRERMYETGADEGIDEILGRYGNKVELTEEQMGLLLQQPNMQIQIKMLDRFLGENAKVTVTEKPDPVDQHMETVDVVPLLEAKDDEEFC